MHRTPTTTGAAKRLATPSPTTTSTAAQDAARTFIRRPEAKRRSLENMDTYKKMRQNYASMPSGQLLQDLMKTFEDIPSKVQEYPQMRRDIKQFLEVQSDKGIRAIFELSRRIQGHEAETITVPGKTSSSEGQDVLRKLEEVEASLTTRLEEMKLSFKTEIEWLKDENNGRGSDLIDKVIDRIEETGAAIDQTTREVEGRSHALLKELAGGIVGDVVAAKQELADVVRGMTRETTPTPIPTSYASVAAAKPDHRPALHSMAVTFEGGLETADEVLARVKRAVDARGTGLKISKVRKAKNQTIILGCDTEAERKRVQDIIESRGNGLTVAPMINKNPLVVLKDVFEDGENDDIVGALRVQNTHIFAGLPEEDMEMVTKFKKRTRNPKTSHVILQVRPNVWKRMTEAGHLYLDLQRVRVEDQSPLIQCTKCLAFGHGRKFCTESVDGCSHCGGPHLREKCADYTAGNGPQCRNCSRSGLRSTDHNAFSGDCPVRKKWDYLARANTAYA